MDVQAQDIEVLHGRSDQGVWEMVARKPDPRLSRHVHGRYCGWVETAASTLRRREVPKAFVPMILNLGPDFGVLSPGNSSGGIEPFGSFVAGLHDTFAVTEAAATSVCLQVNLTPLGARQVLGLAMHMMANRVVGLADVIGAAGPRLIARLHDAPDWPVRFAILDRFLLSRIGRAAPPSPEVAWVVRQIRMADGAAPVGALAAEIGWTPKRLIARFHDEIGLPPKTLARILRFERAVGRLSAADPQDLATLALDCGYYDQAHFNRDFRALAGCTPTAFLCRRMPGGGLAEG